MLTNTFRHIPGIGLKTEMRFWEAGIHTWDDMLCDLAEHRLSASKIEGVKRYIEKSKSHLQKNPLFFAELLNANQHWRLFSEYRDTTAYLDIETTGLNDIDDHITTIAVYDGKRVKTYVYGENLNDFVQDIQDYQILVSYNGKSFDVPFIERFFGIQLKKAHIDLRYVLRALGFSGGLKSCEKQLGIDRGTLDGVDGYFAVILWSEYLKSGDRRVLETLLAYNVADVVNLEILMVEAFNLSVAKTPFAKKYFLPCPAGIPMPFFPDLGIIESLKVKYRQMLY